MNLDGLQLESPRLLLRLPRNEDLDPWAEMMLDPETARFIGGVMPRSVAATNWAFDQLGWTNVIHSIAPENVPSQVVARKLGSRNLGPVTLPAPYHESRIDLWGQSRDEWRARRLDSGTQG